MKLIDKFQQWFINDEEDEHCPSERMGHICQVYAGKFIVIWGGHRVNKDSYFSKIII